MLEWRKSGSFAEQIGPVKKKLIRKYPRVKVYFPVEYTVEGRTLRGHASTLGGGGLFLEECDPLARGTEVVIRFRPAKHLKHIEAKARVCYYVPGQGIGVEFTDIGSDDHQLLLRLIHHKTPDRRQHPRVPFVAQVYCEECMWLAFSRDISAGGMFIETKQPMALGTHLTLRFHLDDGGPIVVATAEVRYVVPKMGLGLQFVDLMPAERKRLEAYVAKSAPLHEPAAQPQAAS